MNEGRDYSFERVCFAFADESPALDALDVAAALAEDLDAELTGLFMEDENVLRAAAFPFTREMGLFSGSSRPLNVDEVERTFRVRARQAQAAISGLAEGRQLRWSFTTLRGSGLGPLLTMADERTLAVIAPRKPLPHPHAPTTRRGTTASRLQRPPIAALYDGSDESFDAVLLALLLARMRTAPLVVLDCTGQQEVAARLRDRLQSSGSADGLRVRYVSLRDVSPASIANAASHAHAALFIVSSRYGGSGANEDVSELLGRLDCPLVLLRRTA